MNLFLKNIYKLFLLITVLIYIAGCSDMINITGAMINGVNADKENKFPPIRVSVTSGSGELLKNFQISIIELPDSVYLFTPVMSSDLGPAVFVFNENQINPIKNDSTDILVIAYHPSIGVFTSTITLEELKLNKPQFIEFNVGTVLSEQLTQDKAKYLKFKY